MDSLGKFIKNFDYFGFTPQFRINGDIVYKSFAGGLIFICFIIFALEYFASQLISFVKNTNFVKNSRILLKNANPIYLLNTSDLYMGLGLFDHHENEFNVTQDFPYLDFNLSYNIIDSNSNNNIISNQIPLEKCNISYLLSQDNLNRLDKNTIRNP